MCWARGTKGTWKAEVKAASSTGAAKQYRRPQDCMSLQLPCAFL
jgi:hypothetical protein